MKKYFLFFGLLSALWFVACAVDRPAVKVIPDAEMAVLDAKQAQANKYAPQELEKARKSLNSAKEALEQNLPDMARRYSELALVDAEYAKALAQNKRTQEYVTENTHEINKLSR